MRKIHIKDKIKVNSNLIKIRKWIRSHTLYTNECVSSSNI